MKKIILASTSPRRKELLKKIGLNFKVVGSNYEENMNLDLKPLELAKHLSKGKAKEVMQTHKNHIIIAADTFIAFDGKILGKPITPEKAIETLKIIEGKSISVISGITIIDSNSNKTVSRSKETKVFIKKLSNSEIESYVKTGEPLDKAGAFAIQGLGAVFIEKIEGDYYNVMGLPLNLLYSMLKEFEIDIWKNL